MRIILTIALLLNSLSLIAQHVNFKSNRTTGVQVEIDAIEPNGGRTHVVKSDIDTTKTEVKFTNESVIQLGKAGVGNVYNLAITFDSLFSLYYQVYLSKKKSNRVTFHERPSFQYPLPKDSIIHRLESLVSHFILLTETVPSANYIMSVKLYDVPNDTNKTIIVVGQYLIKGDLKKINEHVSNAVNVAFKGDELFRKLLLELIGAPPQTTSAEPMETKAFDDKGKSGGLNLYVYSNPNTYTIYLQHK